MGPRLEPEAELIPTVSERLASLLHVNVGRMHGHACTHAQCNASIMQCDAHKRSMTIWLNDDHFVTFAPKKSEAAMAALAPTPLLLISIVSNTVPTILS